MYADLWSPELRQGDVFGEIPFPLSKGQFQWISPGTLTSVQPELRREALMEASPRFALVVSHDCEFNEGKRSHFTVARIESISKRTTEDELDHLRFANDVRQAVDEGVTIPLDTFLLEAIDGAFDEPMRANFGCLAALPMTYVKEAAATKRAELLHDERIRLRQKLGYFFGRDADDLEEHEKTPKDEILAARLSEQPQS